MRKHSKKPLPHQRVTVIPPKPKIHRVHSWWIGEKPEGFTQRAAQEAFQDHSGPILKSWCDPI